LKKIGQTIWEAAYLFWYNFLKFINQSFLSLNWMYLLCIPNLIISYKSQPLLFAWAVIENKKIGKTK